MQNFVVHTQFLENYGAHAESGRYADGMAYWKMKGGDTYVVQDLDRIQDAVAFVAAIAMDNSIGGKEFPVSWSTLAEWEAELAKDSEEYADHQRKYAMVVSPKTGKKHKRYLET